jgi:hypothetical protein
MSKINSISNLNKSDDTFESPSSDESSLDVNMIISIFQEKLSQMMTELVIKDATIRQQTNLINKLKGNK